MPGLLIIALGSFVVSPSFWDTLKRKRTLRSRERELFLLNQSINETRQNIADLQKNPAVYEQLVRRDLGYLRPGETEIRFRTDDANDLPPRRETPPPSPTKN